MCCVIPAQASIHVFILSLDSRLRGNDNTLFCGHNNGVFQVQGDNATKIFSVPGTWNFLKINTKKQEAQLTTVYLLCNPPKGDNDSTQSDGNNNGKFSG